MKQLGIDVHTAFQMILFVLFVCLLTLSSLSAQNTELGKFFGRER